MNANRIQLVYLKSFVLFINSQETPECIMYFYIRLIMKFPVNANVKIDVRMHFQKKLANSIGARIS